ncbi:putative structural constituent of cell wall [Corchorus olitorius]|uniref:Structural constituent of cell wall n=1 Tax=Corchorus olitorius TaxID=93759 RepID=A0A1R3IBE3_9ROSI|nr:putative structural constituent of cell wall [Corchorus olitorius]
MARLSWLPIAFFIILALSFATQIANAGKEGSVRREGEMPLQIFTNFISYISFFFLFFL